MNAFIQIDLCENKLEKFRHRIQNDVDTFVEIDLHQISNNWPRYRIDQEDLKLEFLILVEADKAKKEEFAIIIDEWADQLFLGLDISSANTCRTLLQYLFLSFKESNILIQLSEKFQIESEALITNTPTKILFDWFAVWTVEQFPAIASIMFYEQIYLRWLQICKFGLSRFIQYVPAFCLWNLQHHLFNAKHRNIILFLAKGKNIRQYRHSPFPFTKRMAHHFVNAPMSMSFDDATWYAVVKGLGAPLMLMSVLQRQYAYESPNPEFVKIVVSFFAGPGNEVTPEELRPLIGFLQHLWDENNELSIQGWTLASLRRRADQWYDNLHEGNAYQKFQYRDDESWKGANYQALEWQEDEITYQIIQLCTVKDLRMEGKKMRHCVGGYTYKCVQGMSSIWSLRKIEYGQTERLVTIEVDKNRKIIQARGKFNCNPGDFERELIDLWAMTEGLYF